MAQVDVGSDVWRVVKALCDEGLGHARGTLEIHGLPGKETEYQRGFIAALCAVLELGKDQEAQPVITTQPEY